MHFGSTQAVRARLVRADGGKKNIYGGFKRRRYRGVEEKRACLCQETSRKRAWIEEGGGTRSERAEGSPCRWGSPGCGWEWSSAGCWSGPDLRIHTVKTHTDTQIHSQTCTNTLQKCEIMHAHTHTHTSSDVCSRLTQSEPTEESFKTTVIR